MTKESDDTDTVALTDTATDAGTVAASVADTVPDTGTVVDTVAVAGTATRPPATVPASHG